MNRAERVVLSERDTERVLDLLENPARADPGFAGRGAPASRIVIFGWREEAIGRHPTSADAGSPRGGHRTAQKMAGRAVQAIDPSASATRGLQGVPQPSADD